MTDVAANDASATDALATPADVAWGEAGLIPVVAQDATSGDVLTVAYANELALTRTLETGEAHYWSRSRAELWRKGATSGHVQRVRAVLLDCDGDALVYRVDPAGPACHTGARTCFFRRLTAPSAGAELPTAGIADADRPGIVDADRPGIADADRAGIGSTMGLLQRVVDQRWADRPEGSYVAKLAERGVGYVAQKVVEEAGETIVAALEHHDDEMLGEAADLLFHLTVLLRARGLDLNQVAAVLEGRHRARG